MKGRSLKHIALILALVMAAVLAAGCNGPGSAGTKTKDGDKVLFTYDGKKVTLKEAWLYTKMEAAQYESFYSQYYGDNFWSMAIDEKGTTMEDSMKENAISQIRKIIVLVNKAKEYDCSLSDEDKEACKKYADAFAKDQTGKGLMEECGAKKEDVLKIYEDNMLAHKVQEAMVKDVDTKVSDDEARKTKINRVTFATVTTNQETGEEKKLNDKQKEKMKDRAQKALTALQKGEKKIDEIAKDNDYTDEMEEVYAKGESEEGKDFEKAIDKLKDGAVLDQVFETEHGYVIAQLVAKTDKEATKENKEDIIEQRKQDAFNAKYDEWTKELDKDWDYKKEVDQDLLAQLKLAEEAEEGTTEGTTDTAPAESTGEAAESTTAAAEEGTEAK